MKARQILSFATVFIIPAAILVCSTAAAQRNEQSGKGGGQNTRQAPQRTAQPRQVQSNRPRANQGHVPHTPPARTNPGETRQPERLPTGHVNEVPHVNHDQWFGHEAPNDARFHLDHPFANGRFTHSGSNYRYRVSRIDRNLHRFWVPGGYFFEVAPSDWSLCEDWCWDCGDDFTVYDDPDHSGWYMLYNVHTGVYVHVQYMGK
jgi:hypothetical protein